MKYGGMLTSIQVMESLAAEAGRADSEMSRNDRRVTRETACRFMLIFLLSGCCRIKKGERYHNIEAFRLSGL